MAGKPCETRDATAVRTDRNPSPSLGLDIDSQTKWDDEPSSSHISSNSKGPVKKRNNREPVPEAWERAIDDEVDGGYMPKQSKGERRRLKQRERRQKWRHNERELKAEAENEGRQKIPDPAPSLPKCLPVACTVAGGGDMVGSPRAKRHRLSPKERTLEFLINLFEYDTRPADWDLVCIEPGEYTVYPHYRLVSPLSRPFALDWEIEYEGRRLRCLCGKCLKEAEAGLIEKQRELTFYKRHMRNKDFISSNLSKHLGKFNDLPMEHAIKVLYYGQLVLQRVITRLEAQQQELLWHVQYACNNIGSSQESRSA
ncbi:hypothetical protein F5B21DRAFT_486965 [Xylaria acuta]|nr:hypothetical protein F5B21DRAFT_486965 [Xylaria acuta]